MYFCILLGFGYFDVDISIYLWRRPLTASCWHRLCYVNKWRQASWAGGSYWSKLHPVAILFKLEILGDHLCIYVELW